MLLKSRFQQGYMRVNPTIRLKYYLTKCGPEFTINATKIIKSYNFHNFWWGIRQMCNMMTSSHRNIFPATGQLCGNSPVIRWIPAERPVTRSFGVFPDLLLNKRFWINNGEAGDLRLYRAHYDVIVMDWWFKYRTLAHHVMIPLATHNHRICHDYYVMLI